MALHFIIQVRFNIFLALAQSRQGEGPEIDPRVQIFAKFAFSNQLAQIAHRSGDQLKITAHLAIAAKWVKGFLFNGFQQHCLFVCAQFANLIKKQHATVGAA